MTDLVLTRQLDVRPPTAFEAWTLPDRMRRWWWPFFDDTSVELDPRVGGRYRLETVSRGFGATGSYLVVDPPRRLRFTWNWVTDGVVEPSTDEVEVGFEETPGGTTLTLTHTLDPRAADPEALRQGWDETLDVLTRSLPAG